MTKEELKIQIEKKYDFYEELAMQGAHHTVLQNLESQLERMMERYNNMK